MTFFVEPTRQPFTHIEVTYQLALGQILKIRSFFFTMIVKIKIVNFFSHHKKYTVKNKFAINFKKNTYLKENKVLETKIPNADSKNKLLSTMVIRSFYILHLLWRALHVRYWAQMLPSSKFRYMILKPL